MPGNTGTSLSLRIDWSEQDNFGHVNNVMFMKYIQASRINYWEAVGILEYMGATGIGPMLAAVECNYKKSLFYPGNITIHCRAEFIKTTSFGFFHQIFSDSGELAAEAKDVMVMYDFKNSQKAPLAAHLREKIETLEKRQF